MSDRDWYVNRHWGIFWRLECVAFSDWAGVGIKFHKSPNGRTRTYWTKKQAVSAAEVLNAKAAAQKGGAA